MIEVQWQKIPTREWHKSDGQFRTLEDAVRWCYDHTLRTDFTRPEWLEFQLLITSHAPIQFKLTHVSGDRYEYLVEEVEA